MDPNSYNSHYKILVAVDCIIFGFDGMQLKVLLVKRGFEPERGKWSLVGGFVGKDESADAAAARVLHRLTGIRNIYMEQLYTFGDVNRDSAGRIISIAYFALIDIAVYNEQVPLEDEVKWFALSDIPDMIFDHEEMLLKAKQHLRHRVMNHPVGFELLPSKFTLPQLQSLYEAIYETPIDRRNFNKKMRSLGILKKLDEKEKESSKKGAFYYVVDTQKHTKVEVATPKLI